jgi:hypothetical protein
MAHMYGVRTRRSGGQVCHLPGSTESAQLGRGVCDDLRQARIKTAIGNLAHALSPACELGKVCTDAKGVCPR